MEKSALEKKFNAMKLADLKKYLLDRGVSVNSYLKPGLVAIACAVEQMNLPLLTRVSKDEEQVNVRQRLHIHGCQLPDPFSMKVENDFKHSPPFGLFDIFNHLIYHSSGYDKQGLAAYKSYEDYRLFDDGYVESLLTLYLEHVDVHIYVGKVKPAMREKTKDGKQFYDLWFVLEGKGASRGSVVDAYCECLGGRDGGCKHIAAALYSLENLLNSRGEESVTSGPCLWARKARPDTTACELKDLTIAKKKVDFALGEKRTYTFSQYIDHDPRIGWDRLPCGPDELEPMVQRMRRMRNKPAILHVLENHIAHLEGNGQTAPAQPTDQSDSAKLNDGEDDQYGIMEKKVLAYLQANQEADAQQFSEQLHFTQDEVNKVESSTKKQWQCKQWFMHKTGFVTASKTKSVYTRQKSVEKHDTDVSLLVNSLINNKVYMPIKKPQEDPKNPLDWGLKHENSARKAYYQTEGRKHHQLSLVSKGFIISSQKPFLGASPDNVTTCRCKPPCNSVVVEYKCPWVHRDSDPKEAFLTPEIGGVWENDIFSLKKTSRYYYQVQIQMLVTGLKECHFVVWTSKGIFCHQLYHVPTFTDEVCGKVKNFWVANVVPKMMEKLQCFISTSSARQSFGETQSNPVVADNNSPVFQPVPQTDTEVVNIEQQPSQSASGSKSMLMFGVDIYQEDLDTLHPGELINDTMLTIMLSEHCCEFPIVDSLFYSILVGEQELSVRTSTRLDRMKVAVKYFKPDLLKEDYVFIPINRGFHWFLGVISPWHILILDSLTWDIETRETELDNIARYVNYLTEVDVTSRSKERLHHVLKVPRQASNSNNCAVFVSLFVKHFLKDIEEYEKSPDDYVASAHHWFNNGDATEERGKILKTFSTLFYLDQHHRKS